MSALCASFAPGSTTCFCGHVDKPLLFPESREMLILLSLRKTKKLSSFELQFNLSTGYSYNKLLALFKKILKHQIPNRIFPNGKNLFVPLSENVEMCQSLICVIQLGWGGHGARKQKLQGGAMMWKVVVGCISSTDLRAASVLTVLLCFTQGAFSPVSTRTHYLLSL